MDRVEEISNTAPTEYHLEVAMKRIQELENKDREFARDVRFRIVQQLHNPQWDENLVISRADTLVEYILNGRKIMFNEAPKEGHAAAYYVQAHNWLDEQGILRGDEVGEYSLIHRIKMLTEISNVSVAKTPTDPSNVMILS